MAEKARLTDRRREMLCFASAPENQADPRRVKRYINAYAASISLSREAGEVGVRVLPQPTAKVGASRSVTPPTRPKSPPPPPALLRD